MDSEIWTKIGKISEAEFDGDVSATLETLCKEALVARFVEGDKR